MSLHRIISAVLVVAFVLHSSAVDEHITDCAALLPTSLTQEELQTQISEGTRVAFEDPNNVTNLMQFAISLQQLGDLRGAVSCYEKLLHQHPELHQCRLNCIAALTELINRKDDAVVREALLGHLLVLDGVYPSVSWVKRNIANLANQLGAHGTALQYVQQALQLEPRGEEYDMLGWLYMQQHQHAEALAAFLEAERLLPHAAGLQYSLARALAEIGRPEEALSRMRRASEMDPENMLLQTSFIHMLQGMCVFDELEKQWPIFHQKVRSQNAWLHVEPFVAQFLPFSAAELKHISQVQAAHKEQKIHSLLEQVQFVHVRHMPLGRRMRIGYLSAVIKHHVTCHLLRNLFTLHDRSRFEVYVYALNADDGSSLRQHIMNTAEHFVDLSDSTDLQVAQRIYADQIDVLIDMNGYIQGGRPEILALQPAPLQIGYLVFIGTMGAPYIPYIATDIVASPPDRRRAYTEKFIALPLYQVLSVRPDSASDVQINDYAYSYPELLGYEPAKTARAEYGLAEDAVVYCDWNGLYKLDYPLFQTWLRVLQRLPNAQLWLLRFPQGAEQHIHRIAAEFGIDPQRIVFSDMVAIEQHLQRIGLCDVFLDTHVYNGGVTVTDTLWAGVPVITYPGEVMGSRMATSLLHSIGLSALSVNSLQQYEQLAVTLGEDHVLRENIRNLLKRFRSSYPLFDTRTWVQHFEKAIGLTYENVVQGQHHHTIAHVVSSVPQLTVIW